ncbi:MAG: hypothetical protein M5R36_26090 [Deltaproteobacteria bacterium]|nr:hypothetical protein [Deltaproteobacteria bacterium]
MANEVYALGSGQCPVGTAAECASIVQNAFERHGVCTEPPCYYIERDCNDGCGNSLCIRNDANSCGEAHRPDGGQCPGETAYICCDESCGNGVVTTPAPGGCGIYNNYESCMAACTYDIWSYQKRLCMEVLSTQNCSACNGL